MAKQRLTARKTTTRTTTTLRARARPDGTKLSEFLNRETAWLQFNDRVLHEALDERTPLLERVRFMGIVSSNLDEFFMKRLAGLKRLAMAGSNRLSGGMKVTEELSAIRKHVDRMLKTQAKGFREQIEPALLKEGIQLIHFADLTRDEREFARHYFRQNIFPVLTPLAVDPGLPFPFISNLSTSLGVTLQSPEHDERLFARIKVPNIFPHWIWLKTSVRGPFRFLSLLDLISNNLVDLFPDMKILDVMPFRITRNAEIERDDDEGDDLMEMVAEELKQRRFGEVVRLEHRPDPDHWMIDFLKEELELRPADVYEVPGLLDYADLKPIVDLPLPHLKFEPWTPMIPPRLRDERTRIFDLIREEPLLVHHPFESFSASVERFLREAVDDPAVIAIKMTLYRTGDDSPFIPLLTRAAERGKQVVVLIELKARFDEERNIHWAHQLENAGVHVVYGVIGLKTHAKVALVVRRESEALRCYAHFGTGNYHKETAKLYTDLGLFTCDEALGSDVVELFNFLTGRSRKRTYRKLLVAPAEMRQSLLTRIETEISNVRKGLPAHIIIKCNSLEERDVIRALYRASKAGVKIQLIVRGFCCLRPGVPGMSENIQVVSVIGRFLEHARIFYFADGARDPLQGIYYIGSADVMYRNLLSRIETLVPVEYPSHRSRIWEILSLNLADQRSAWDMNSDGTYKQRRPPATASSDPTALGSHRGLMETTRSWHEQDQLRFLEKTLRDERPT